MHQQLEFDAIIVGSGFGGAVITCRLAQAGFNVLLIERGRRYEGADFPALPKEGQLLPDLRRWLWKQDQGLWDVEDLEELVSVQAAGYGGGSLIYANVHLRPPAAVFDASWPEKFRGRATLDPFFDLAAYMLGASPADAHSGFPFRKSETLRRAADELGRKDGCFTPLLAINTVPGRNRHGEYQNACTACGKCCSGCPERAKNTLDMNYLAVAEQNGAEVLTQCEVKRIRQTDSGWSVQYFDHLQAEWRSVGAKSLFVCAGALHSTRLLSSARLKVRSREVKRRVGLGYFPNADALAMIYDARQETLPSRGPAITTAILHSEDDGRFFMIQDGGFAEELERLFGVLRAPLWLGRNRVRAATVPPPQEGRDPTPAPSLDGVLPSPLDGLLSAVSGGALEGLLHRDLRAIWPEFVQQFQRPLLLPRVVDSTIERTLAAKHRASFFGRHLGAENVLFKIARRLTHRLTQLLLARSDVIGAHAFQALLSGADSSREDFLREVLGFERSGARNRLLLLAMGSDAAPGVLLHDRRSGRMIADLDLYYLAPGYSAQERLMHDIARNLGGELRLNPAWSFLGKPITVHGQGGCRMSDDPALGVTDWSGEVHGCPGLYVVDGSVFCRSVGVNPSATILAIAEHSALTYIRRAKQSPTWPANDFSPGARQYQRHRDGAELWRDRARRENWAVEPPSTARVEFESSPLGVKFDETMRGY
ncbi:MAG TPA: GMC oxidoreductase, partial [Polyangiaceae bacterium]